MGVAARDITRLVGFDNSGEVFLSDQRVLRGIYPGDAAAVRSVLEVCYRENLFSHGIVGTRELEENPFPELGYETVLEHERIPFVTYPHEWPPSMLREAAIFHAGLFLVLGEHGLTLKDWHPYNILFDGTEPKFVDFTSIIPLEQLQRQGYLAAATPPRGFGRFWDPIATAAYEMYRVTCEPYFSLPLIMMRQRRYTEARRRLYETALNATMSNITRGEAFAGRRLSRIVYELADRRLRMRLAEKDPRKRKFFSSVRRAFARRDIRPRGSAYSSYYVDKKEAFSTIPSRDWTAKQHSVRDALLSLEPKTVLDLGSNTGWFSILAARLGSSVVAVDLDEACIDTLFAAARRERLRILPLVANLTDPVAALPARVFPDEPSLSRIGGDEPLYKSADERLRGELLLALAIVHHLALGQGLSFERIARIFDKLAAKHVCVEFVDVSDEMIVAEPGFFPAYHADPHSFQWYTLDNFLTELRRHFPDVVIRPSYPETRVMITCSR